MNIDYKTLDKKLMSKHVYELLLLDKKIFQEMGSRYGSDVWGDHHFLKDYPKKWEYSLLAFDKETEMPCGFLIASEVLPNEIHIHRLAIDLAQRGRGVGAQFLRKTISLMEDQRCQRITVELSCLNAKALNFYQREGFEPLSDESLVDYVSKRKEGVTVVGNRLKEANNEEFLILECSNSTLAEK